MKNFCKYIVGQLKSKEMWKRFYELNIPTLTKEESRKRGQIVLGKDDIIPVILILCEVTFAIGILVYKPLLGYIIGTLLVSSRFLIAIRRKMKGNKM